MKRSKNVRLILIAGISAGALAGCSDSSGPPRISDSNVYANNYYLPGVGYYHAPFRAFYQYQYNYYDPQKKQYFFGGQWGPLPNESITNVSSPTVEVAKFAEAKRTDIQRGGFGCIYGNGYNSGFHS